MLRDSEVFPIQPIQSYVDIRDILNYIVPEIQILISIVDDSKHASRFYP